VENEEMKGLSPEVLEEFKEMGFMFAQAYMAVKEGVAAAMEVVDAFVEKENNGLSDT